MAGAQTSKGYRVDEFDMENPNQRMHDFLDMLEREAEAGRGDDMVRMLREKGGNDLAGLAAVFMRERGKDTFMEISVAASDAIDAGDLAGALAAVDRKRADGTLTAGQALYIREISYVRAGNLEAALEAHEEGVNAEPGGVEGYAFKADMLYRLGRTEELEEWCRAWEGSDYSRTGLYLNRARLMYVGGDADGARRRISAMLTLDKFIPGAHELQGAMLADAGDWRGAILRYNRALHLDYNIVHLHIKKAEALMGMGRPDSAALACRRGLEIRPANARLRDILGEAGGLDG
ncbi:MAG: hypothetical protein J4G04_06920 [Nitrosopumilaceae archaeon]|nr:hypothetical protein [Nitrosopumilaceae archaeon]